MKVDASTSIGPTNVQSILYIAKLVTPVSRKQAKTSMSISRYQLFFSAFPAFPPTYSNFAPDEISVFGGGEGGTRINRRYYSCNWQSRGNFWLV